MRGYEDSRTSGSDPATAEVLDPVFHSTVAYERKGAFQ